MKIKNQHHQVIWYLINWKRKFSLADVINHSMFYKFQTRLGEIESEHGILTEKTRKKFINTFGRESSHNLYECIDIEKAKLLIDKY